MTLILTRSDVTGLVTQAEVVAAVEAAHADIARATAAQPAPASLHLASSPATFLAMAALADRQALAAVKVLADVPGNAPAGLPVQRSVLVLLSQATGACEAIIHGQIPTRMRTAAASAVASRHLSRPDSKILGLIGAGDLAVEHVAALMEVRTIKRVRVWSRTETRTAEFSTRIAADFPDVVVEPVRSPRDAFVGTDIVCTLTPSREPIVEGAWFAPGQHINAVGAPPRPDHREIDSAGMARASIVLDSRATATQESGDLILAIADGTLSADTKLPELGEVIAGLAKGRTSPDDITLYNSVGIAMQDLAIGSLLLARARQKGVGLELDLAR